MNLDERDDAATVASSGLVVLRPLPGRGAAGRPAQSSASDGEQRQATVDEGDEAHGGDLAISLQ